MLARTSYWDSISGAQSFWEEEEVAMWGSVCEGGAGLAPPNFLGDQWCCRANATPGSQGIGPGATLAPAGWHQRGIFMFGSQKSCCVAQGWLMALLLGIVWGEAVFDWVSNTSKQEHKMQRPSPHFVLIIFDASLVSLRSSSSTATKLKS